MTRGVGPLRDRGYRALHSQMAIVVVKRINPEAARLSTAATDGLGYEAPSTRRARPYRPARHRVSRPGAEHLASGARRNKSLTARAHARRRHGPPSKADRRTSAMNGMGPAAASEGSGPKAATQGSAMSGGSPTSAVLDFTSPRRPLRLRCPCRPVDLRGGPWRLRGRLRSRFLSAICIYLGALRLSAAVSIRSTQ